MNELPALEICGLCGLPTLGLMIAGLFALYRSFNKHQITQGQDLTLWNTKDSKKKYL